MNTLRERKKEGDTTIFIPKFLFFNNRCMEGKMSTHLTRIKTIHKKTDAIEKSEK